MGLDNTLIVQLLVQCRWHFALLDILAPLPVTPSAHILRGITRLKEVRGRRRCSHCCTQRIARTESGSLPYRLRQGIGEFRVFPNMRILKAWRRWKPSGAGPLESARYSVIAVVTTIICRPNPSMIVSIGPPPNGR
jgi:hypothetical protein